MGVKLFSPRLPSEPLSDLPTPRRIFYGRLPETLALLLGATALFLVLALLTLRIDPFDPTVHGADWVGMIGATIGGWLAQSFGATAWLVPLELLLIGAPLFRGQIPRLWGLRLAGDIVVLAIVSALVYVASPESQVFGNVPVGGDVGLLFGELMQGLFSTVGSFLVGLTSVGLILIGRSSFSFISGCQAAARWGAQALRVASALARRLWARLFGKRPDTAETGEEVLLFAAEADPLPPLRFNLDQSPPAAALGSASPAAVETKARKPRRSTKAELPAHDALSTESSPAAAELELPHSAAAATETDEENATPTPDMDAALADLGTPEAAEVNKRQAKGKIDKSPRIVNRHPEAELELQAELPERPPAKRGAYQLPEAEMLMRTEATTTELDRTQILENATRLEKTLKDYGVAGKVEEIHPGPTVTTYEVTCEAGTKVSKVASLADDLALGLSRKVRIVAPIPGKNRIGFELPNDERVAVGLRELIEDSRFQQLAEKAPLPVVLGRDIVGAPCYTDLSSMPHVIVAGATGAGKSVGLNVMLSSLLFKRTPDELRLLMVDPKVVELAPFDGIPHMLLPVVTDMKQAATALRWAVNEMERRYQLFAAAGTRNITSYNGWVKRVLDGEVPPPQLEAVQALTADGSVVSVPSAKVGSDGRSLPGKLPYIVIVVDEFADLMMQQGKEVETSVARLAQKARAAGMHVVLATQRPSVDVITGMIKANFPSRIGFRVAQKVDSRTILDEQGAEMLLGRGDMLVKLSGANDTKRVQCPFVSEEEVSRLTDFLRAQGAPQYFDAILEATDDDEQERDDDEPVDVRFDEAVRIISETRRCSTSWLQRKMTIGYNRAAKMVEMMEKRGIVGPPNGAREREVLISPPP